MVPLVPEENLVLHIFARKVKTEVAAPHDDSIPDDSTLGKIKLSSFLQENMHPP